MISLVSHGTTDAPCKISTRHENPMGLPVGPTRIIQDIPCHFPWTFPMDVLCNIRWISREVPIESFWIPWEVPTAGRNSHGISHGKRNESYGTFHGISHRIGSQAIIRGVPSEAQWGLRGNPVGSRSSHGKARVIHPMGVSYDMLSRFAWDALGSRSRYSSRIFWHPIGSHHAKSY